MALQCERADKRGIQRISTLENPPGTEGIEGSAWMLPEMKRDLEKVDAAVANYNTCAFQSDKVRWFKPGRWAGRIGQDDFKDLCKICRCPNWVTHKSLVGKAATEEAGAYPKALAEAVAKKIVNNFKKTLDLEWWRFMMATKKAEVTSLQESWIRNMDRKRHMKRPLQSIQDKEEAKIPSSSSKMSKKEFKKVEEAHYVGGEKSGESSGQASWSTGDRKESERRMGKFLWSQEAKPERVCSALWHQWGKVRPVRLGRMAWEVEGDFEVRRGAGGHHHQGKLWVQVSASGRPVESMDRSHKRSGHGYQGMVSRGSAPGHCKRNPGKQRCLSTSGRRGAVARSGTRSRGTAGSGKLQLHGRTQRRSAVGTSTLWRKRHREITVVGGASTVSDPRDYQQACFNLKAKRRWFSEVPNHHGPSSERWQCSLPSTSTHSPAKSVRCGGLLGVDERTQGPTSRRPCPEGVQGHLPGQGNPVLSRPGGRLLALGGLQGRTLQRSRPSRGSKQTGGLCCVAVWI